MRDPVDVAITLSPTLDDHASCSAQYLLQAHRLRMLGGKVVTAAVQHARAEGCSWSDLAMCTGITTKSVADRWEPEERRWRELAQRARHCGLPRPHDPHVVFAAQADAEDLDLWAARHPDELRSERWAAEAKDPLYSVSGGLTLTGDRAEP